MLECSITSVGVFNNKCRNVQQLSECPTSVGVSNKCRNVQQVLECPSDGVSNKCRNIQVSECSTIVGVSNCPLCWSIQVTDTYLTRTHKIKYLCFLGYKQLLSPTCLYLFFFLIRCYVSVLFFFFWVFDFFDVIKK